MSYYQASGLHTTIHTRPPQLSVEQSSLLQDGGRGDLHEPFLNYLLGQQVFVKPRIDLFTKTKFMEIKQRRINRR